MSHPSPPLQEPLTETGALIDSIKGYAIFMLGPTGDVRSWNEGARLMTGWEREDILGCSFTSFYTEDDRAAGKPERLLAAARADGRVEDEGWRLRKDGSRFWADVVLTAVHDADGRFRGFIKVSRDLTDRRRAAERLQVSQQETELARTRMALAEEAVRGRDDFIAASAHELRTPLTALQLTLEGLARVVHRELGAAAGSRFELRVDGAMRQARRLGELVERLLDVSRLVSGSVELRREEVDLGALVLEVLADLQRGSREPHPSVRIQVAGDARGSWDRHWLRQALFNLLANALEYGGGEPIDIAVAADETTAQVTVVDRGIGMSTDDIDRIFGRFERAVSMRHYSGLGLGLFVTRQAVEAHGGTVRVDSTVGQGSTFVIELPRRLEP